MHRSYNVVVSDGITPVNAFSAAPAAGPGEPEPYDTVQSILIQALHDNTGRVWVLDSLTADPLNPTKALRKGILAVLAVPTPNSIPSVRIVVEQAMGGSKVSEVWILPEVAGQGVSVAVTVG